MSANSKQRILIVDDDKNIRNSVQVCLEEAGYLVEQAVNGATALETLQRDPPDIVLLDLAMPVMDGMTVLAEIHNMMPSCPTRIVVITAHGSVNTAITAIRLGASDFLEKPFVPEDLRLSIASVLHDGPAHLNRSAEGYDQVLQHVRDALRARSFAMAEQELMKAGTISDDDAAFLNLAGVLHECHGRIESARKFYERAAIRDPSYQPAVENLNRLVELRRYGRSERQVALGGQANPAPERLHGSHGNWRGN